MAKRSSSSFLNVEQTGQWTVVHFNESRVLDAEVLQAIEKNHGRSPGTNEPRSLLLDLANIDCVSSQGLARLIRIHKQLEAEGQGLVLGNVTSGLAEILKTTGLDRVLKVQDSAAPVAEEERRPAEPAVEGAGAAANALPAGRKGPTVVVCDHQADRAAVLVRSLQPEFNSLYLPSLEDLPSFCHTHQPLAVVLPLHWPGAPGHVDPNDSPVWPILETFDARPPSFLFADSASLPGQIVCRGLAVCGQRPRPESSPSFLTDLRDKLAALARDLPVQAEHAERMVEVFAAHRLIGRSSKMIKVFSRAHKAAVHLGGMPILIQGETGTGKGGLAAAIHQLDPERQGKPFQALNCSTLNETLAESQLFGHSSGAFSGAEKERLGIFRSAQGGTVLLDEIGELKLELQTKLLRVLEEKQLLPLGEDYERRVDIRIIAATNRELSHMVNAGQFREDLYQRLSAWRIDIPPRRERPEDIVPQAQFFLQAAQRRAGIAATNLSPEVIAALERVPWEGNTRQLKHCMAETLAYMGDEPRVELEHLPTPLVKLLALMEVGRPADRGESRAAEVDPLVALAARSLREGVKLDEALNRYERRLLELALEKHGGTRREVGEALGLSRQSILKKMKKYGLG